MLSAMAQYLASVDDLETTTSLFIYLFEFLR